ncbi:MAG: ribonuclease HI [Pseudomonadota bacterium]|nr:ribonuclease HI [Pseudomonadota bacterium]
MIEITIHTDGACSGNPGPGGWGAILTATENGTIISEKEIFGGDENTTNNRMELTAAIKALQALKKKTTLTLITDSKYLRDGMTIWLASWVKNNWKSSQNKEIKNKDLWQDIHNLSQKHQISWNWVKGHDNHPGNERADYLARKGMLKFQK